MSYMLKLSDRKLKMTMVNILMALVGKVDKMHEQMENFWQTKTIRNNEMKMLKIRKNMVKDEERFYRLISSCRKNQ